jgi:hypothetical protein
MGSYTIVAIPDRDDYVWKISSEKVPHLTILNLGVDIPDEERVIGFVQHVVDSSLCRFGMTVDRRDTLGPKEADVLLFKKRYDSQIENFRANLLKDPSIFQAYSATEQYDAWTPHLTLGYPETPAKNDPREYPGFYWVNFDRIAVWTEDYSGPEFELKDNMQYGGEVAYSYLSPQEALAHFGIKGMRWGVRNASGISNDVAKAASGLRRDPTKEEHKAQVSAAGGLHKVSDKDLKNMLQRLENEKKFQAFMQADAERRKQGLKTVAHILGQIGKIVLPIALGVAANRVVNNAAPFRTSAFINRKVIEG